MIQSLHIASIGIDWARPPFIWLHWESGRRDGESSIGFDIIDQKRNWALQGIALISALEQFEKEVVDLVNEGKKRVEESIAHAAQTATPALSNEESIAIARAVTEKGQDSKPLLLVGIVFRRTLVESLMRREKPSLSVNGYLS